MDYYKDPEPENIQLNGDRVRAQDATIRLNLIHSTSTRSTPVYTFRFYDEHLILAAGPYCHDHYSIDV